jgi:spore maturation protein CgeB
MLKFNLIKKIVRNNYLLYKVLYLFRKYNYESRLEKESKYYAKLLKKKNIQNLDDYVNLLFKQKINNKNKIRNIKNIKIFSFFADQQWVDDAFMDPLNSYGSHFHYDWSVHYNDLSGTGSFSFERRLEMNTILEKKILEIHSKYKIDIFFCYASEMQISKELLKKINSLGIITINLAMHENGFDLYKNNFYLGYKYIAPLFDLNCIIGNKIHLNKYIAVNSVPYYWAEGASPETYYPKKIKKDIDVLFVGHQWTTRIWAVNFLKRNGINISIFGREWDNGPLKIDEMNNYINRSKIILGFGGLAYSNITDLKARDFEVPMAGGFYLVQENVDLKKYFNFNKEIVVWSNLNELLKKINYFLLNDEEREKISRAAYTRSINNHTWKKRFDEIINLIISEKIR